LAGGGGYNLGTRQKKLKKKRRAVHEVAGADAFSLLYSRQFLAGSGEAKKGSTC